MLGVLWIILKIILIVIAVILGLVLIVLAVLLFCNANYMAVGEKSDDTNVRAMFKWLFGIVRANYEKQGETVVYSVHIPFGICSVEYNSNVNNLDLDIDEKNICNNDEFTNKTIANIEKNSKIYNIVEKIKDKIKSLKNTITKLINKVKFIIEFNDKYDIGEVLSALVALVVKLIKALGFKTCSINAVIGFEDPSTTGKVLGFTSIVNEFLPFDIELAGNFDKEEFTGDFNIKGKTNLWKILLPIVVCALTKPIFPLLKDYWRGDLNGRF